MDNEVTTIKNGELVVRTTSVSGTRLPEKVADKLKYVTTYIKAADGTTDLVIKTYDMNGGGGSSFDPTTVDGYDATAEQKLINDEGTLRWIADGTPAITWYTGNTGTTLTILDTSDANLVEIYKNGLLLQQTQDYSISGTTLTLTTALEATDKIAVKVNDMSSADLDAIEALLHNLNSGNY